MEHSERWKQRKRERTFDGLYRPVWNVRTSIGTEYVVYMCSPNVNTERPIFAWRRREAVFHGHTCMDISVNLRSRVHPRIKGVTRSFRSFIRTSTEPYLVCTYIVPTTYASKTVRCFVGKVSPSSSITGRVTQLYTLAYPYVYTHSLAVPGGVPFAPYSECVIHLPSTRLSPPGSKRSGTG